MTIRTVEYIDYRIRQLQVLMKRLRAERRVAAAEHFMAQLQVEAEAEDLEKMTIDSPQPIRAIQKGKLAKKQDKLSYR